jgi:glucose-1-phosphate adenylyltransferase
VDKHAVVGAGTYLGWGEDLDTPNRNDPDKFFSGITIVGENAHIPAKLRIGRNVVIQVGLDEAAFDRFGGIVPSGRP